MIDLVKGLNRNNFLDLQEILKCRNLSETVHAILKTIIRSLIKNILILILTAVVAQWLERLSV